MAPPHAVQLMMDSGVLRDEPIVGVRVNVSSCTWLGGVPRHLLRRWKVGLGFLSPKMRAVWVVGLGRTLARGADNLMRAYLSATSQTLKGRRIFPSWRRHYVTFPPILAQVQAARAWVVYQRSGVTGASTLQKWLQDSAEVTALCAPLALRAQEWVNQLQ